MLLLDTCTLLWLASGHERLSDPAKERILASSGLIFVSAISAFEIGVKHRKGALELPLPPPDWYHAAIRNHGVTEIPMTGSIAITSALLPPLHADPCDRIIVATASAHDLEILTPDPLIQAYPDIRTSW